LVASEAVREGRQVAQEGKNQTVAAGKSKVSLDSVDDSLYSNACQYLCVISPEFSLHAYSCSLKQRTRIVRSELGPNQELKPATSA
jgi:hypothetical protein